MTEETEMVEIFRRLALEAGSAIMEVYAREDFGLRTKADASPVTEADEAADRIIREGLAAALPGAVVITEEAVATHALGGPEFVIVDPLDGTKEFVKRGGDFTVNIALVRNGTPVAGVVYAPAQGRLFLGSSAGAFEERGTLDPGRPGPRTPISAAAPDGRGLLVVASKSHRDQATDDYIARYPVRDFTSAGSSLKFCLVVDRRGTSLPAARADDGVGHRRGRRGAARGGGPGRRFRQPRQLSSTASPATATGFFIVRRERGSSCWRAGRERRDREFPARYASTRLPG